MELTPLGIDASSLRASLGDCLAHCGDLGVRVPADVEVLTVLRSEALRDASDRCLPPAYRADAPSGASFDHETPMVEAFAQFTAARRSVLPDHGDALALRLDHEIACIHSLVAADWQSSYLDGAGTEVSLGFLDGNDLPPWDSWLALAENPWLKDGGLVIVCWVPQWATSLVQSGMNVLVMDNVAWIERSGADFLVRR